MTRLQTIAEFIIANDKGSSQTTMERADATFLVSIARQTELVRDLQRRFYAGEKTILGECKAAERALDDMLNGDQPTLTFGGGS
jgi:hypothetical protein